MPGKRQPVYVLPAELTEDKEKGYSKLNAMIRPAEPEDTEVLISMAISTDIFQPGEAEELLGGVLHEYHSGLLGEDHRVEVWVNENSGKPEGWVYFAPSFKAEGVWDLWWIGVDPQSQGKGIGGKLLEYVESCVLNKGARLLIIETSSTKPFDSVRNFYAKRDYESCGRIPDFYGKDDDKITFAKRMSQT